MIALIAIPHQTSAKIHWYADRDAIENAALESHDPDSAYDEPTDFDDSVQCLAHDWAGHILVESAADIDDVRTYTSHQASKMPSIADELEAEFCNTELTE